MDLPRRGGPVPPDLRPAPGGPRRHPRPRRHRRPAGGPGPGHPAAAVPHRPAQDLHRRGGARARPPPPSTPRARWSATWDMAGGHPRTRRGRPPPRSPATIEQVPPMVSAVKVGRAPPARARPRGDRGRAGAPAGHGAPLRRGPDRRARASSASRSSARRAPTSGCWPPTSGPRSAVGPTCATCGGPRVGSFTDGRGATASTTSAPAPAHPGRGPARPRRRRGGRRGGPRWSATACPLDRVPLGATGDGPWALVDAGGRLLAVYEATDTDRMRPAVVLARAARTARAGAPSSPPQAMRGRSGPTSASRAGRRARRSPSAPTTASTSATGTCSRSCAARAADRGLLDARWSPSTATRPRWCAPSRPRRC